MNFGKAVRNAFYVLLMVIVSLLLVYLTVQANRFYNVLVSGDDSSKLEINAFANLLMAVGTIFAVIVAIFRNEIYSYITAPRLQISEFDVQEVETGRWKDTQKWLGFKLINDGAADAKNVQVYFSGIDSDKIPRFAQYFSIPVMTSWTGESVIRSLPTNLPRRWDICYLEEKYFEDSEPASPVLTFAISSSPNNLVGLKMEPDKISTFRFRIDVIANNGRCICSKLVEMKFLGSYEKGLTAQIVE